jgi:hypothetical protein
MEYKREAKALLLVALCGWVLPAGLQAQALPLVPAGTRFLVELRTKLDANEIQRGKKFEARTLEPIATADGRLIPGGRRLEGRVSYVEGNHMLLRFEEIETGRGKQPIVATVTRVVGEHDVRARADREGEIETTSHRGRDAIIGAAIVGSAGAAIGATRSGHDAAIGAAAGAGTGAMLGALQGGDDLVLDKGTRLELQLDRPLGWL